MHTEKYFLYRRNIKSCKCVAFRQYGCHLSTAAKTNHLNIIVSAVNTNG